MGTINLMLPDALHARVHEVADKNKVSINLLVATALAEKLLVLRTEDNPAERNQKRHVSKIKGIFKGMYHSHNKGSV